MEEQSRIKKCKECGLEFYGRLNQYFCSAKCRFDFNNSIARNNREDINSILKILLQNREILKGIFESGTTEIPKSDLQVKSYNFTYLTHQLKPENGKNYIFCFEYGYLVLNDTLKITKYDGIFSPVDLTVEITSESLPTLVKRSKLGIIIVIVMLTIIGILLLLDFIKKTHQKTIKQ